MLEVPGGDAEPVRADVRAEAVLHSIRLHDHLIEVPSPACPAGCGVTYMAQPFTRRQMLVTSATVSLAGLAQAQGNVLMPHIVLLGDSVFDNEPYVASGRDVTSTLRRHLPSGWQATLLAQDGAVLANVRDQAQSLPFDATHLFVSAGGNDGLRWMSIFDEPVASVAEALRRLAAIRREFQTRYQAMLDEVSASAPGRPMSICTIYDVRFPEPAFREVVLTALTLLNDVITREAGQRGMPLLDLRTLLNEEGDFANPIEPSALGSEKLATAILEVVRQHDLGNPRSTIFAGPKPV